jgi:hypothetical protein
MLDYVARDWWMVGDLLEINIGTVLATRMECLTKDRVERLLETLIVDDAAELSTDCKFHALYWVCRLGS